MDNPDTQPEPMPPETPDTETGQSAVATGPVFTLKSGDRIGADYTVLEPQGAGSMGEVYRVRHEGVQEDYALKILSPALSGDPEQGEALRDRFRREASVMARLKHPNIVPFFGFSEDATRKLPYLTMEFVCSSKGRPETLQDRVESAGGGLPEAEVKHYALQLCDALAYAHEWGSEGVVHRDLKPGNILLRTRADRIGGMADDALIADFGLVKVLGADAREILGRTVMASIRTASGSGDSDSTLVGNLAFMSPEQSKGAEATAKSDLYALGAIIYYMLTGERPEGRFKLPSQLGFNRAWDTVINACLQPRATDRVQSARELRKQIERIKVRRRSRTVRWMVAAVLLAVAAAGGWYGYNTWMANIHASRSEAARIAAEQAALEAESAEREARIAESLTDARRLVEAGELGASLELLSEVLDAQSDHTEALTLRTEIRNRIGWAELIPVQTEALTQWGRVQSLDRGQGFGDLIDACAEQVAEAQELAGGAAYGRAIEAYQEIIATIQPLLELDLDRQSAARQQETATTARNAADAETARDAAELWQQALAAQAAGDNAFDGGDFAKASQDWQTAAQGFAQAHRHAQSVRAFRTAKAAFEATLQPHRELLDAYGGEAWDGLQTRIDAVDPDDLDAGPETYAALGEDLEAVVAEAKRRQAEAERLQQAQAEAKGHRTAARDAQAKARAEETERDAAELWQQALAAQAAGDNAFEGGDFAKASQDWQTAAQGFAQAHRHAQSVRAFRTAQAAFEAARQPHRELLDAHGGEAWDGLQTRIDAVDPDDLDAGPETYAALGEDLEAVVAVAQRRQTAEVERQAAERVEKDQKDQAELAKEAQAEVDVVEAADEAQAIPADPPLLEPEPEAPVKAADAGMEPQADDLPADRTGEIVTEDGDRVRFSIENGEATITQLQPAGGIVRIPSTIHGAPVIHLGPAFLSDNDTITEVVIPDSVTHIGNVAFFRCSKLHSVQIGNSVTTIGQSAFRECSSLVEITIPDSVTHIGNRAFQECHSLTRVIIGDKVTQIGDYAFENCRVLESVVIGSSVAHIGDRAFSACRRLQDVVLPNSVTNIGQRAFSGCVSFTEIVIPDRVVQLGGWAFSFCRSLTDARIGHGVPAIETYMFSHCERLERVFVGSSVKNIGRSAFVNAKALHSIYFYGDAPTVESPCFQYTSNRLTIYRRLEAEGWPEPGELWNGIVTTIWVPDDDRAEDLEAEVDGMPDEILVPDEAVEVHGPVEGQNWTSPSTGMEFVWIDKMNLWVGKFEVTNEEYRKMKPDHNSGAFGGHSLNDDRQPVVRVNFDDAKAYAAWLTQQDAEDLDGARYRLPSNDEWTTFAQCGDDHTYPWGNQWPPPSGRSGNYSDRISGYTSGFPVTAEVDKLWENPWGLYGVGGNVWEACASDSSGGSFGAWRGASWSYRSQVALRVSLRLGGGGSYRDDGFRLVLSR